jgi:ATP-dependent DNA helicase RecG
VMDQSGGVFGSGKLTCRWFNMPYIHKMLAAGQDVVLYGKVKEVNGRLFMDHPEFEIIREDDGEASVHVERVVPIYRNISGISQRRLREIMHLLLHKVIPDSLELTFSVEPTVSRSTSFRIAHFPDSLDSGKVALRRFALEEFFGLQMNIVWRRASHRALIGRQIGRRTSLLKLFYESLPFDLTGAQKRSIKEIVADLRAKRPMNRLLQGDVGSGKTFVALAAMLMAVDSGVQAALMAPTQILAEQHYLTFCRWLEPLGVRIALRTGNRAKGGISETGVIPQIVIGTHALLYDPEIFTDLGLIVIDEQHKFGVSQRAALIRQGNIPDVLVMTATPIPRTLAITVYGDLDVSLLDEKPPGRAKMITAVRIAAKQSDVTKFVKNQLADGHQVYLVYPLVEESETLNIESAIEAFGKWAKRLSKFQVGLIHGKLKPEEKEKVMQEFREGKIDALISTTVIEVGVDVPNASVMILHHAERFGLAQIHQLRGRVGRGGHKGYCILLTDGKSSEAMEKLKVLEKSSDGFEIAEADLRLRGPGDVLGKAQSGLAKLRFVDFLADTVLLREARALADQVMIEDPQLTGIHQTLRSLIKEVPESEALPGTA